MLDKKKLIDALNKHLRDGDAVAWAKSLSPEEKELLFPIVEGAIAEMVEAFQPMLEFLEPGLCDWYDSLPQEVREALKKSADD